mmetsp:Transcript_37397/g.27592  ORF Transcript_37397/g.27592 Transcript_37397/m.27592 type:complete len:116 (+) Transcript_37397:108-455(+)
MALQYKEEGNMFYKQKEFQKAISKYARVQCFTKSIMPSENFEVAAFQNLSKKTKSKIVEGEELEKCKDLVASTLLNMSICFYQMQKYQKCIDKATESLAIKPSIKAYYRRAQALA